MSSLLQPGTVVHTRYRIVRLIGQGGMGAVYEAVDQTFGSKVALKQMFPNPNLSPQQVAGVERAFDREAKMLNTLRHMALPRVNDYFSDSNGRFLVMDYVEGEDLSTRLNQCLQSQGRPLSEQEVIPWSIQVLRALEYLHQQQPPVIHRDIKPHNITVTATGEVFLLDFGISKGASTTLTTGGQSSVYAYTLAYAPLEQIQGTGTEPRSDLFSLGATMYHLLTGHSLDQPPRCDALTRASATVRNQPDPLTPPPSVSQAVQAVLMQALAPDPNQRPTSATAMRQALERAYQGSYTGATIPISASPASPASPTEQTTVSKPHTKPAQPKARWFTSLWMLLPVSLVVVICLVIGAMVIVVTRDSDNDGVPTMVAESSTSTPTAPAAAAVEPTDTSTPLPMMTPTQTNVPVASAPPAPTTPPAPTNTPQPTPTTQPQAPTAEPQAIPVDPLGVIEVPANEPVVLGYALVTSGPNSNLGIDSMRGIEIAIDDIGGEILGHEITLVGEDSMCSPEGGQTAAYGLTLNEQIVGIVGPTCSSAGSRMAPLIDEAGMVIISPSNTAPLFTDPSTHFEGYLRTAHNDKVQGIVMAEYAYNELGLTRAATIHDGSFYAYELSSAFAEKFEALGGQMVAQEAINENDTDMEPVLTHIASLEPELLYYPIFMPEGGFMTRQTREVTGLENVTLMVADGLFNPDFIDFAGDAAIGVYLSSPDLTYAGDKYADFLQKHQAKYNEDTLSVYHANAYDATMLILNAVQEVAVEGEDGMLYIPRQALRDAIYTTKEYQGLSGILTCDEHGDCADPNIVIYEIVDSDPDTWNPGTDQGSNPRKIFP